MIPKNFFPLFGQPVAGQQTANHGKGQAFLPNKIATVEPAFDSDVKTGRAPALGADNDLPIPIHAELGAEVITGTTWIEVPGTETGDFTSFSASAFDLDVIAGGGSNIRPRIYISGPTVTGSSYVLSFNASITADTCVISAVGQQTQIINYTVTEGLNIINYPASADNNNFSIYFNGLQTFDVSFTDISVKEVTSNDNSFITYHDIENDIVTQVDNSLNPPAAHYILNDVTVNNILTHKMPFSAGDLNLIQQEPNLLAALALGEATPIDPSFTLDATDSWYACSEVSGADVFDARVAGNDTTISGDLTNVRVINQQTGLQTTALLLDANGVPDSYNSTANTARVYDDTIISTGFKPSIARYSIEEESSGLMQDFGVDRFIELNSTGSFVTDTVIDGGYKFVITTGSTIINSNIAFSVSGTAPTPYDAITFNAVIHNGSLTFTHYYDGSAYVPLEQEHTVTNGRNIMIVPPRLSNTNRVISSDQTPTYEIDMTDIRIEGLTTKTQRTEKRLLTHTADFIGPEIFAGAALDTNADFAEFTINTSAQYTFDEPSGEVSHNAPGFETYLTAPISGLVIGATYEVSSDATVVAGNPHYTFSGVDITGEDLGVTARFVAEAPVGNFGVHCISGTGIFTFRTLSIKRVTTEDKYYIGVDGGALVEQTPVPPLPDPDTIINPNNTCVIGYPDTIDVRLADFNVYSEVIDPADAGQQTTIDLDHDGLLDTVIGTLPSGTGTITADADSINIDLDGDGDADIVIPT